MDPWGGAAHSYSNAKQDGKAKEADSSPFVVLLPVVHLQPRRALG